MSTIETSTLPKYQQVREHILELIRSGDPGVEMIPSERELCRILRVSRPTVRQAIDSLVESGILVPRPGTGTFVNHESLATHRKRSETSLTVGLILARGDERIPVTDFEWSVLENTVNGLRDHGVGVVFSSTRATGAMAAAEFVAQGIQGLVWLFPGVEHQETITLLQARGIPVLQLNRDFGGRLASYVKVDQRLGAYLATKHLIDQGHRNILLVPHDPENPVLVDRMQGYQDALIEAAQMPNPAWRLPVCDTVYEQTKRLLADEPRISAIFVSHGMFLFSVIHAIKDLRRRVPDDISLVSFDIRAPDAYPGIDIVTIRQPLAEMGRQAAESIVRLLHETSTKPHQVVLPPVLVPGTSTRRI